MSTKADAYGSSLAVTLIGVFLNMATLLARSEIILVESSRSFATAVANFPVSFWTFCGVKVYCQHEWHKNHRLCRAYLDVCFNFDAKLLKMLNDGTIDRTTEVGMLVSDNTGLVSNSVVYVLKWL